MDVNKRFKVELPHTFQWFLKFITCRFTGLFNLLRQNKLFPSLNKTSADIGLIKTPHRFPPPFRAICGTVHVPLAHGPASIGLHHTYSYGKHCGIVFVSVCKKRHSKNILHRCKIYSTTGIRIDGNLH